MFDMYDMFVGKIKGVQYQLKAGHVKSWFRFYHEIEPIKEEIRTAYDLGGLSTEEFYKLTLMMQQTLNLYKKYTDMH